jgi:DNA-binding MarR family transcriptional regulator
MSSQDPLADRLQSAAIHLLRRLATVDVESGLSPARLSALSVIVYAGPLSMSDLARAERVSPSTITSTVTGLEDDGLVARRRDPGSADGRLVTVAATAKGRKVLTGARRRRLKRLERDLQSLPARDRTALDRGVAVLERLLDQEPC